MLAFMLISAVAFSAWMRYARLPSSFLRRSSASRLLVKAALAEAIDEIDAAIGNNPYPGVGTKSPRRGAGSLSADLDGLQNEDLRTRNHWLHRVYIGTNQLHEAADTVSTLTFEGLAYIPPALVNEARYYSRRSQAGIWKHLGFDSGRYAFCAIDVSDHFDVNALSAKLGRSSSAAGKISLAYLFENDQHTAYEADPNQWDDFIEKSVQARKMSAAEAELGGNPKPPADSAYVPFVSVADLNLAIHAYKPAGWMSPFCQYLQGGGGDFLSGVGVSSPTGPQADKISRMSFVADGWFPEKQLYTTSAGGKINPDLDLCEEKNQPFPQNLLDQCDSTVIRQIMNYGDDAGNIGAFRLKNNIGQLGLAMLYDYLDENSVPLSLAIPSVERIPMIVGIKQDFSALQLKVAAPTTEPDGITPETLQSDGCPGATLDAGGKTRTVTYKKIYRLDGQSFFAGLDGATIQATVAFPFPRGETAGNFKLDGHVELFFTTEEMGLRPGNAEFLHVRGDNSPDLPRMISGLQSAEQNFNGTFHLSLGEHSLAFPQTGITEDTAVIDVDDFNVQKRSCAQQVLAVLKDQPLLTVTWEHKQRAQERGDGTISGWVDVGEPKRTEAYCGIPAYKADGSLDPAFKKDSNLAAYLAKGGTTELRLNVAISLRVKNDAAKTVDLVPAYMGDDDEHNGINNFKTMTGEANRMGQAYPLMLFKSANALVFDDTRFDKGEPVACDPQPRGVMCPDPRWNWAPEHWFQCDGISKSTWLQKCHELLEKTGSFAADKYVRDRDIFLATSDTAYLQSVYELAFLPRVTPLLTAGNNEIWGDVDKLDDTVFSRTAFALEADFVSGTSFPNRHMMWTTYRPFDRTGQMRDDFESVGFVSNGGGYKINPYSVSTNVVLAAFANTPYCWWAASLNPFKDTGVPENDRKDAQTFNKKYCFNELSGTKQENLFKWADLKRVANNLIIEMQRDRNDDDWTWEDSYDELDWSGEMAHAGPGKYKDYFGVPRATTVAGFDSNPLDNGTCDLYDIDRKFLYGYWRECFAVKQQLFLVFVRAEPMMMGGGAAGQSPPQLGARAVALVWRDPTKSPNEETPHKTRVLFYHQFD